MKWKLFIPVLLLVSQLDGLACGYYPYGDELRFCFLHPQAFGQNGFSDFQYSASTFWAPDGTNDYWNMKQFNPNHKLWFDYCNGKVPMEDIRKAMDSTGLSELRPQSRNRFYEYLHDVGDREAINYLKFAKLCEELNMEYDDPWERNQVFGERGRKKLIATALRNAERCKKPELSRRYAFLALRLSFYNQEFYAIHDLYDRYFRNGRQDVLLLWSAYFNCFGRDKAFADFMAAQVFAATPDKRFAIQSQLYSKSPVADQLKFAKTDGERANVYAMAAIIKYHPALDDIRSVYSYQPKSEFLDFLIVREINKMEDWIFTPYYSLFNPSVTDSIFNYPDEQNSAAVLRRVEKDRKYAGKMLAFISSVNLSRVNDKMVWNIAKAELLLMTKRYDKAIALSEMLERRLLEKPELLKNIRKIKALALSANQPYGNAVILPSVREILLENKLDQSFVFAIGRELENKGNTTDAALLYSTLKPVSWDHDDVYWRQRSSKFNQPYFDYYDNYFSYLNIVYTPIQVAEIIRKTKLAANGKRSDFEQWLYATAIAQQDRLNDLLGMKYMRRNDLARARNAFGKVSDAYWKKEYGNEKNYNCEDCYTFSGDIFDADPFFELKDTPKFSPSHDLFPMNKLTVLKQLMRYIALAESPKTKDRGYYYFLVANCYYNMSFYGNSWMMARFSHENGYSPNPNVEGDRLYYGAGLARDYYFKAYRFSKKRKFKALCLRMAGTCEERNLFYDVPDDYDAIMAFQRASTIKRNRYFRLLNKRYPGAYEDLAGTCDYFQEYYKSRF